jgi:ribosomal protein S20
MKTMSRFRLAGMAGLLIAAALAGGTIIGSVAAATAPPAPRPVPAALAAPSAGTNAGTPAAEACATFRSAFAAALGVDESKLTPAAKQAAISTIDAAPAAGGLTKSRADRLKARIEAGAADGCALLGGRIARIGATGGGVKAALGVVKDGLTAAAGALGMMPAELGGRLRGGETLKDVATAKGVPYATVSAAVVAAIKSDLDAAVAAGTIKQAREDRILARLQANLADGRLRGTPPAAPVAPAASGAPAGGGSGG